MTASRAAQRSSFHSSFGLLEGLIIAPPPVSENHGLVQTVDSETTTIAGAPYDPAKGKFFLIDIKTAPPTVTQLNPELPWQIPDLSETAAAEKFGQDTLNGLRKTNKQIDEFCQRIEAQGP